MPSGAGPGRRAAPPCRPRRQRCPRPRPKSRCCPLARPSPGCAPSRTRPPRLLAFRLRCRATAAASAHEDQRDWTARSRQAVLVRRNWVTLLRRAPPRSRSIPGRASSPRRPSRPTTRSLGRPRAGSTRTRGRWQATLRTQRFPLKPRDLFPCRNPPPSACGPNSLRPFTKRASRGPPPARIPRQPSLSTRRHRLHPYRVDLRRRCLCNRTRRHGSRSRVPACPSRTQARMPLSVGMRRPPRTTARDGIPQHPLRSSVRRIACCYRRRPWRP